MMLILDCMRQTLLEAAQAGRGYVEQASPGAAHQGGR
jgi:hypothetical protein